MKVFDKNLNIIVEHARVQIPCSVVDGIPLSKRNAEEWLNTQLEYENYEACKNLHDHINKFDDNGIALQYFCDNKRHLVCMPYSIKNLHKMARTFCIKKCWFHRNHYDIPKKRIDEITNLCTLISSKDIVNIINKI